MNQHSIQEAYLKKFCVNGRLWAYDKKLKAALLKPASKCTTEEDFQSEFLEILQNDIIENPGIKSLRKLLDGKTIDSTDYEIVRYWIALHIIRNKKYREIVGNNYELDFNKLLDIEKTFSNYFRYCYLCKCDKEKYFITSDNPILELTVGNEEVQILTLSPDKLILLTPIDDTVHHNEVEFTELINSMIWANAVNQVFSNRKELPISEYENNTDKLNLNAVLEKSQFKVKNKIS